MNKTVNDFAGWISLAV